MLLILFALLLAFLTATLNSLQASFFPEKAEAKGLNSSEYGLVFGVYGFTVGVLCPITGALLIPRLGARVTFYTGLLLIGFAACAFGLVSRLQTPSLFLSACVALRVAEGAGAACVDVSLLGILVQNFPDSIATSSGVIDSSYGVGYALGPLLGAMLYRLGGFPLPFIALGVVYIALAPVVSLFVFRGGKTADASQEFNDKDVSAPVVVLFLRRFLRTRSAIVLVLTELCTSTAWGFVVATLEPFVRQQFQPSTVGKAFFYSIYGGTFAILVCPFGIVADRWLPPMHLVAGGTAMLAVAFALIGPIPIPVSWLAVEPRAWLTCFALFLVGAAYAAVSAPAHSQFIKNVVSSESQGSGSGAGAGPFNEAAVGVANGVWFTTMSVGNLLGPLVGGILLDAFQFRYATYFPLGILLTVMALQWSHLCDAQGRRDMAAAWRTIEKGRALGQRSKQDGCAGEGQTETELDGSEDHGMLEKKALLSVSEESI